MSLWLTSNPTPMSPTHEFVTALIEKRAMWPTIADVFPSMKLASELNP
jgi:hypothetical protein